MDQRKVIAKHGYTRLSRVLHQMHRDLTNTFEAEKEVKPSGENEGKSNRLINAVRQSSRLLEITFMFAARTLDTHTHTHRERNKCTGRALVQSICLFFCVCARV